MCRRARDCEGLVLALRYVGADWANEEVVHVELCDFEPQLAKHPALVTRLPGPVPTNHVEGRPRLLKGAPDEQSRSKDEEHRDCKEFANEDVPGHVRRERGNHVADCEPHEYVPHPKEPVLLLGRRRHSPRLRRGEPAFDGCRFRHEATLPGHYWESRDQCVRHGRGSNAAGGYQPTGRRHQTGPQ